MRIGITGQAGFVGTHLFNLANTKDDVELIPFKDEYFNQKENLNQFVRNCDVIVHLAAMNRHEDKNVIYQTNIKLVESLILAMESQGVTPHVLFSSSSQEERDNLYGQSKLKGRQLFEEWAIRNNAKFTGLIIPNVFGPFGQPFYNSFVATFCHQLNNNQEPHIQVDASVKLIYVGSLAQYVLDKILTQIKTVESASVPYDFEANVTDILAKLVEYRDLYLNQGIVPKLENIDDIHLFNTFVSYMDIPNIYPRFLTKNSDDRGDFVEVIKIGVGGQVSFSTTKPGITRGNHYHTRKIERFAVIKGKAIIELRKIGTTDKMVFELDGECPSYVDMPVWYTHNIKNVGDEDLYTQFWINEWYNADDPDTFFEEV